MAPVPSVLPSSTMRISAGAPRPSSAARISTATASRFAASLNAITTTVRPGASLGPAPTNDSGRSAPTGPVPVPGDGALQPFLEIDRGLEAEKPAGLVDVGDAQFHVRERPLHEGEPRGGAAEADDHAREVVDGEDAARVADVEGLPHRLRLHEGE